VDLEVTEVDGISEILGEDYRIASFISVMGFECLKRVIKAYEVSLSK